MEAGRGRTATSRNGVVVGSIWESRMKIDEVKGGIKVFNGEEEEEENSEVGSNGGLQVYGRLKQNQSSGGGVRGKRKTWKPESVEGIQRSSIQIRKTKPGLQRSSDEACKELSLSFNGSERSPIERRKTRSLSGKQLSVSVDGIERSPIQIRKTKSESHRVSDVSCKELGVSVHGIETESSSIQVSKSRSDSSHVVPDEPCKEFGVCTEKIISNSLSNEDQIECSLRLVTDVNGVDDEDEEFEGEDEEEDTEMEIEKSFDVKEISIAEQNPIAIQIEEKKLPQIQENSLPISENVNAGPLNQKSITLVNEENKILEIHEKSSPISATVNKQPPEQKPKRVIIEEKKQIPQIQEKAVPISGILNTEASNPKKFMQIHEKPAPVSANVNKQLQEQKHKRAVIEEKKFLSQIHEKPIFISAKANKQPAAVIHHHVFSPALTKKSPIAVSEDFERIPRAHNKLQNIVDLVMWRDVSKSAFVFGLGSFILLSSSFTKDLNFSFISAISYLGLFYLAAIFIYRSFVLRGALDLDDSNQMTSMVVSEEEAIWLLKLILPYLNEFLLKLRCLFSGDPSTTMKLGVLLFVLARSGSSFTIWKMAKLGFFGVFIVPKVCSSYSTQLTGYAKFWIRRFRDAWDSCSNKKAVAAAIFTLVWNLSSIVARIWAVFMLVVVVRYYQQLLSRDDEEGEWGQDDVSIGGGGDDLRGGGKGQRKECGGPSSLALKEKKES